MYRKHFGLKSLPFENVPDPAFFFDEGEHARIRGRITESLRAGRGLIVLTGPIGSGKTTMSQMIKSDFSDQLKLIWIAEPPSSSTDLLIFIGQEFGLSPSITERTFLIRDIRESLLKIRADGGRCLLIIDESHLMTDEVINTIRVLNNLEEGSAKLIQILLLGQKELMDTISRADMEPFRQRIATLEMLGKMNVERIQKYISHRLRIAGGEASVFADSGWDALALAFESGNTPRVINSLCDRSLNMAFERGKKAVDAHDVYDVARGMGLGREILDYIVTLNARERMEKEAAASEAAVEKEPEKPAVVTAQPQETIAIKVPEIEKTPEKPAAVPPEPKKEQPQQIQPNKEETKVPKPAPVTVPEIGNATVSVQKKSLAMPLLLLLGSTAAFMGSILFYWQRSGLPDLGTALFDLIGLR